MNEEKAIKITTALKLEPWQEKLIFQSLFYDFISEGEIQQATKIVKKYNSEDELFHNCNNSKSRLSKTLADASQI